MLKGEKSKALSGSNEAVRAHEPAAGLRRPESALVVASFLSPLLTSAAPKLTWFFLLVIGVILVAGGWRGIDWRNEARRNAAFIAVLVLALYILVSTAWAAEPEDALAKAGLLFGVAVLTLAASRSVTEWEWEGLRRAGLAFAAGALLGALYVLFAFLTDDAIARAAERWWASLGLGHGHAPDARELARFRPGDLRTHVQMVLINFWPALLMLSMVPGKSRRPAVLALYVIAVAIPIFISERASSQLAFGVSAFFFIFAWLWRDAAPRVLAALWCLGFVVILPAAFAAYNAGWHMAHWLPNSARARVIIWEYTAERVLEAPWLGIGADSTEALEHKATAIQPEGYVYPRETGPHAHDVFLQAWYELGVVGVILLACVGVALALRIKLLPFRAQPFAAAGFAAFATSIAFAWSIWQSWMLCAAGLLLLYLLMAAYSLKGVDTTGRALRGG
jgi:O-antigen ligase